MTKFEASQRNFWQNRLCTVATTLLICSLHVWDGEAFNQWSRQRTHIQLGRHFPPSLTSHPISPSVKFASRGSVYLAAVNDQRGDEVRLVNNVMSVGNRLFHTSEPVLSYSCLFACVSTVMSRAQTRTH